MSRRQLSPAELSKDETSRQSHEAVQTENERRLSYLQTADSVVLLPRQTLPRNEVPRTVLFEHQAQTQTTTITTAITTGTVVAKKDGRHDEDDAIGERYAGSSSERANGRRRRSGRTVCRTWSSQSGEHYERR